MTALEHALDQIQRGAWVLTTRTADDGTVTYVAHRPPGWAGPGDAFEEITAPDTATLRARLAQRCRHGT
ncbi:hypothetical protein [Nocardiopsis sp. CNT312]|uniref:hypothetical protein n=1 Tax=Nocardiopsis sp. CNT312 TaxID=1137268 RepID=UPI00048C4FF9|nr:hypothetical protein [Nocardiopsis sp. CNT312]